jgi:hypothetical protein
VQTQTFWSVIGWVYRCRDPRCGVPPEFAFETFPHCLAFSFDPQRVDPPPPLLFLALNGTDLPHEGKSLGWLNCLARSGAPLGLGGVRGQQDSFSIPTSLYFSVLCLRPSSSPRYLMAGLGSSSEDEGDSHSESGEDEAPKLPQKV